MRSFTRRKFLAASALTLGSPAILSALSDTIKFDLRPTEIIGLARLAKDLDGGAVMSRVVDESMTTHWVTPAGAQVELPDKTAIKKLSQDVFGSRAA